MTEPETIRLTKMDAARRQLAQAIRLWFMNGDPVSVHTLAFAAHEILHTLFKRAGLSGLLFDSDWIKDEFRSEFGKAMTSHAVFFKHARHDPDAVREFNTRSSDIFLVSCVVALQKMNVKLGMEEGALLLWLRFHYSHWFPEDILNKFLPNEAFHEVRGLDKNEFFEGFRAHWREE